MRATVIVPTYKRPHSLSRCLDAVIRQETQPHEIIVVARRTDEASWRCIYGRTDDQIRSLAIDIPTDRPGVVAALNAAVDASLGDVVCITDDDAEPHPDWLSRIVATLSGDASIAAVGGRDWIYQDRELLEGAEPTVGIITSWGRIVGGHHLGVGPARDVAVLKGVNLGVRGNLIREVRLDTRLRGRTTEHHWELGLCLSLLRQGFRIVYDPAIAVDHQVQPRVDETRDFDPRQVRDAAHNETLAVLENLSPTEQLKHLFWTTVIGSRSAPGLVHAARRIATGHPEPMMLLANVTGRALAVLTYLGIRGLPRASSSEVRSSSRDLHPH
jgi:GT2 family glycosyltransferase